MFTALNNKTDRGYFVTGTDTGCGKTTLSLKLLEHFNQLGLKTAALKPLSSGCEVTPEGLRNEDALQLQQTASLYLPYDQINPVAFKKPIAPHIAAAHLQKELSVDQIIKSCQGVLDSKAEKIIIEGAGGWLVPINKTETTADLAKAFHFPIILVVGMRLGCLNHSLLTYRAICETDVPIAGWIANCLDPDMLALEENIETLKEKISAPLITKFCYHDTISK